MKPFKMIIGCFKPKHMKTKYILLIIAVSCSGLFLNAQDKWKFASQHYAGITEGESGTGFQLQTINGFRYKTWFAGVGTGLDYYFLRSIPLFLSVNKMLPITKLPFYVNADAGINFPWSRNGTYFPEQQLTYSPSLYWAGGLGYRIRAGKENQGFLINLGYSYKHLFQEYESVSPCLIPPCPVSKEQYDYRLRRVTIKVGWMF